MMIWESTIDAIGRFGNANVWAMGFAVGYLSLELWPPEYHAVSPVRYTVLGAPSE
jgi:hypothetical protein